jgi:IS30 family transposase
MPRKGLKNHTPTAEHRKQAETLAGYGLTVEQIGHVLGCSHDTVKRHYGGELERGQAVAVAKVAQTAFQMAVSGKKPTMTMFWLKTRAHWKEIQHHEVTGQNDGPLQLQIVCPLPRTVLDD